MYLRLFISLFIVSLPPILALADTQTAQAQTSRPPSCCNRNDTKCRRNWPDKRKVPDCISARIRGDYSRAGISGGTLIPAEQLVQIGILIAQGQAKVDDYLIFGYANAVEKNFTAAQTRYSQALELAVKNNDLEGQAIAQSSMGEISAATGNLKDAVSQIALAKDTYQRLGNGQRVSELNQRLVEINKQLQVNPSQLQINPSQLQIDPARIQIDPSRIQIDPSRLQIQK
jgi:hypothetical protein